jgi:hypothetical protein
MQQIEGIKIFQVDGLTGGGGFNGNGHGNGDGNGGGRNLADDVVRSALNYRVQAPLVDSLLQEIGLKGTDLESLTGALRGKPREVEHEVTSADLETLNDPTPDRGGPANANSPPAAE